MEFLEFYNGLTALIFVTISIVVSTKLILKYFKNKKRGILFAGFTWLLLSELYWPVAISFVMILLINQPLSLELYFIIGALLIPFGILSWLIVFTDLVYKSKQKIILGVQIITGVIIEIFFIYFLFTNPGLIVERVGLIDGEYKSFMLYYFLFALAVFLITGLIFARKGLGSEDPSIRLKSKLLIGAFIIFTIGLALDGLTPLILITITIYRILVIFAAFLFYSGFFLPIWIEKLLLKREG